MKISLHAKLNYGYFNTKDWISISNSMTNLRDIRKKLDNGEKLYVEYTSDAPQGRGGTIARIKKIVEDNTKEISDAYANKGTRSYHIYCGANSIAKFEVEFDDRKNKLRANSNTVNILTDYSGPTVWVHNPPPPSENSRKKPLLDRFGREIKLGDLVCFAYPLSRSQAKTAFGNVINISKTNTCYVKNLKLADNEHVSEYQIRDNSCLILMTDDLMDQLLLARLSS